MEDIHILLVEDNEGDIVLTLEALAEGKIRNKVSVVRDGAEALDFLNSRKQEPHLLPDLVLLDINLPKIDGKEVLLYVKNDPALRKIPIVMLTTSSSELDVQEAYNNHANCFITKPVDLDKFFGVIRAVENFWVSIVKLPIKE